jgi:hypothetical protein
MYDEFLRATGYGPTNEEWEIIERVYMYHPAIDEAAGKEQIYKLFEWGGMQLIYDMNPVACKMEQISDDIAEAENNIAKFREEEAALRKRYSIKTG